VGIIVEYLQLWDLLYELELQHDVEDTHIWHASTNEVTSGTQPSQLMNVYFEAQHFSVHVSLERQV
jgi:hypothetical protein